MHCDVLVVGCGPSGCCAAKEAAERGNKVLIIEKKQNIGEPVQCAEYIPMLINQYIKLENNSINNKIKIMRTFLPNHETVDTKAPGFVVNRAIFDKNLAKYAVDSGAKLLMRTMAIKPIEKGIIAKRGDKYLKINPKIIIGADGPKSVVGTWIKQTNSQFLIAKQYKLVLKEKMEHTEVYFDEEYIGGYAWLFPKGKYANVGVGIYLNYSVKLSKLLNDFVKKLTKQKKIMSNTIIKKTIGLIPINGPLKRTKVCNIMLVGDAGGFTHPITGAGILNAVIGGCIAGKIANEALRCENIEKLQKFEKEWKKSIGTNLEIANKRRKLLDSYFNCETNEFQNLNEALKKCWITFRGYYRDE